ncbi:putative quinate permease [Talaromyces pinophilus]|nr:putative quinate permease [Talaromyces pinophilus]
MATVIIPMYSAEMAPKEIRRQLGSMFQFFFTLGVMTSYWMDYGISMNFSATSKQWQIPVAFQLVPGGLLGLGRREEAMASLVWVRGSDSIEVQEEFAEIIAGIEADQRATEGFTWKEFLLPANRYRMFVAVTMQIGVQLTGNKSLAYSSPQVFAAVGAGEKPF